MDSPSKFYAMPRATIRGSDPIAPRIKSECVRQGQQPLSIASPRSRYDAAMSRIEQLIDAMTLEEKLGQLTMTACSYAVTGPVIAGDSTDAIRTGAIGNLLNLVGAGAIHEVQRIAVE